MAKITFVYPHFENLGIEYLMAVCLQNCHEVDYVSYRARNVFLGIKNRYIPFRRIAERIYKTRPHIVAFSCVTDNYQYQLCCAKALKKIMPNVITVFGGIHPTSVPLKVLQNHEVDCVAIGEAENSFSDFLRNCKVETTLTLPENPIEGILFKKQNKIIGEFKEGILADLNALPFPYKKFSPLLSKHSCHEYRTMASRGCPYSCSYCFNSFINKTRGKCIIRRRKVENVINELVFAKKHYSLRCVIFLDDSFILDVEWILEFCNRYRKEIGLPFACQAIPYYLNNRKMIEALSLAGCVSIKIGIESLSEELCTKILHRKKTPRIEIIKIIRDLRDLGIVVQVDLMLGFPHDTLELQEQSLLFFNKYRPNRVNIYWLTYYPKAPIVEIARQKKLISDNDINNIEEGKHMTEESWFTCGHLIKPGPYCGISLLFNYLPLLPKWLISFLVHSHIYRIMRIKNFLISIALPYVIYGILNRKDIISNGRRHVISFINDVFTQRTRKFQ